MHRDRPCQNFKSSNLLSTANYFIFFLFLILTRVVFNRFPFDSIMLSANNKLKMRKCAKEEKNVQTDKKGYKSIYKCAQL